MKTKWAVLAGFAAIVLLVANGCFETSGGSSSNDGPGSQDKPIVVQLCFGVPTCSSTGQGSLDGAVFNAGAGYLYVAPGCANTNDSQYIWIKVVANVGASQIDHYVWTIRNWSGGAPNGIFDNFDQVLDTNGVFKVRTSLNQIRYITATTADLLALAQLFNEQIDVTVMTKDGQMASGYISLKLHNGMATGDTLVYGNLSSADNFSNARLGSYADYFSIVGTGSTNLLSLEGDFDTFLVLYDTNLTGVATNDDIIPGLILNSEITSILTNGATYFVEATSSSNSILGNYSISNSTGVLTPIPDPFASVGSCDTIAGDYAVTEVLAIDLTFDGKSYAFTNVTSASVTIVQKGCDFSYLVNDPTGLIPPVVRMGRLDFTTIDLYNDAYIPQCPEFFISASSITGSGRSFASGLEINSSGTIQGTFLGAPFSVSYTSTAAFAK